VGERQDASKRCPEVRVIDTLALASPEPGFRLEHAAADAADDHRRRAQLGAREPRVQDGFVRRRDRESVGPRTARGHAGKRDAGGDLSADSGAKALRVEQLDGSDRAPARRQAPPESATARAVGADTRDP
jgi:hypothetical protein